VGYPPQQYPPAGQGGYPPQQQAPPGYQQGPPQYAPQQYQQGYPPQQQQGYGPAQQQGYGPPGGQNLWQQAYDLGDASGASYVEGWWPAEVVENAYGTTQAGDKEAWKTRFKFAPGTPNEGKIISTTLSMSLKQNDGQDNTKGLAALFRKLRAMGVPVGEKYGDPAGSQPFWNADPATGRPAMSFEQAAPMVIGRHVEVEVVYDADWGNSKVRGIRMQRGQAGAPAQQAGPPVQQQQQGAYPGGPAGPPMPGYAQQPPQPVGGQMAYNPVGTGQQPPPPGYGQAGPPAQQWQGQQQVPGHPGGMGEFAPQQQPGQPAAPPQQQQYAAPQQPAAGPPAQQMPPPQPPAPGQYNGQQQGQPADQGGAPPIPPWAQ